ncbi:phospholipid scramblase 2 [Drosophila madeirensis]|uniref:Phospholipid scramblase 2 n=1 Tax=Drosophila madeirensis TaxID=30013 RepID=A0AAU9FML4_DROMD
MSTAGETVSAAAPGAASHYISTLDLSGEHGEQRGSGVSSGSNVIRFIWHTLYSKYTHLCSRSQTLKQLVCREANKPLPKKLRHTMRLNKSAKRKGYEYYISDEDRR